MDLDASVKTQFQKNDVNNYISPMLSDYRIKLGWFFTHEIRNEISKTIFEKDFLAITGISNQL